MIINDQICAPDSDLGADYLIGHSFFTPTGTIENDKEWFAEVVECEIAPLLQEYFIDTPEEANNLISKLSFST